MLHTNSVRIIESSAVVNHVMNQKHTLDWEKVKGLEKETRKIQRKIIEGCYIRANLDKCVNLNEGMGISAQYKGWEGAWIRRGRVLSRKNYHPVSNHSCSLTDAPS